MKKFAVLTLALWLVSLAPTNVLMPIVMAASPGSVVINEVAWAGSADSASDEWIELYNTTAGSIDLTGWIIEDDGVALPALSGSIPANGYYLIEDVEGSVNPNIADALIGLSFANTGDSLVLKDDLAATIDIVNSGGGVWPAGDSPTKATMERVDALVSGDIAGNWANSDGSGSTATASAGALIVGTPRLLNSVSAPVVTTPTVTFNLSSLTPDIGTTLTVSVDVADVQDLFSYGFEVDYDPAVLSFVSAAQGQFLSESGSIATSFQSGLENGVQGKLLVAEARVIDPKVGLSGSGTLFAMDFDVIGGEGLPSDIIFNVQSFIADTSGDSAASFVDAQVTPQSGTVDPVTNLSAVEAAQRYSIQLSWNPVTGADAYRVYRKDAHGAWVLLMETTSTIFIDSDAITNGGDIVPFVNYEYQVATLKGVTESLPTGIVGSETRGLIGDNNRSDRVDGRDLDNLARHFAESDADVGFDSLVDTTYDGMVDGSDLIDLGANFALVYM